MSRLQALKDLRAKVKYLGAERVLGFLLRLGLKGKSELFLPTLIEKPEANRVLVLAPHPDDDVIGCGGTLCKHVQADDEVMVAYMTDGSRGTIDLRESVNLVAKRNGEAQKAAAGDYSLFKKREQANCHDIAEIIAFLCSDAGRFVSQSFLRLPMG